MSKAGGYFRTGMAFVNTLSGEKPHSSISDWVEVLSSDRYDETSLDGIPELVDSINLQGYVGTTEASRAIRKKLKYGNVHRQIRALVILRALTDNAGKGFQMNWANSQLLERLQMMATDNLLDPRVKKRLILVFHAWSIQYADEPRMQNVAGLYKQYSGRATRPTHATHASKSSFSSIKDKDAAASKPSSAGSRGFTETDPFYDHSWEPAPGSKGKDTYADLAAAKADAEERRREREERQALERREAEIERREREFNRKKEMAAVEERRRREAEEEAQRRKKAKEERKNMPKRPKFNFEKEKPAVMASVANANQAASNLVNSCRHINRETENITESPRVQENLDKAKAARRVVVRYIQVVTDEEYVGTLLDANEKIVEAIKLYDRLSKPAALDSDSEHEDPHAKEDAEQVERIRQRLEAHKIESQRTGEVQQLQEQQKVESQRQAARRAKSTNTNYAADLQDLDFNAPINARANLPPPIRPDSDHGSYDGGSLSDFSDYDSSEEEYRAAHSRKPSRSAARANTGTSSFDPYASSSAQAQYRSLDDDAAQAGLMDPNDPFGDPFADENEPSTKRRMGWAEI